MGEVTCHLPAEIFKNFDERIRGRLMNGPRCGKWVLEVTGDSEILVQVNLTEFSCGRLVSGDVEVRPRGQ